MVKYHNRWIHLHLHVNQNLYNFVAELLKGMMYFFVTQCPQIYITLTQFEDNDGRKLLLKILLAEVL